MDVELSDGVLARAASSEKAAAHVLRCLRDNVQLPCSGGFRSDGEDIVFLSIEDGSPSLDCHPIYQCL